MRHVPCRLAIPPSSLLKDSRETVRPYQGRTSMRPQVFTTSRRVALSDASQACFSSVALVGFAPFRGFSSLVADVADHNHHVRLSLSRLSALMAGFVVVCCLILRIAAFHPFFRRAAYQPEPSPAGLDLMTGSRLPLSRSPAPLGVGIAWAFPLLSKSWPPALLAFRGFSFQRIRSSAGHGEWHA